ncbi:hypothetical protein EIP86_011475 [Pleurotus ostreatoroseus]|nr:hypothetical protein EIP86_011475 [Pleurotus ostreatoroseus]
MIASEVSNKGCVCKTDGPCNCCTPRAPRNRRPSKATSRKSDREGSDPDASRPHEPAGLVVNAHVGDYRPVLPRPSSANRSSPPRSSHSPSGASHVPRGQLFFSPYGRAYEYAHGADLVQTSELPDIPPTADIGQVSQLLTVPVPQNYAATREDFMSDWLSSIQPPNALPPPLPSVLCNCGPDCSCPGCVVHQGSAAMPHGFTSCVNPNTCNACLECTMLTLTQNPALDEWFRQLNASSDSRQDSAPNSSIPTPPPQQMFPDVSDPLSQDQQSQSDMRFDPTSWQSYALWNSLQGQPAAPSPPEDCCGGQCKCSPGACNCPADCCGCCQGCTCADCVHEDRTMGNGKTLTFAISGERAACCGRRSPHHVDPTQQAGPSTSVSALDPAGYQGGLDLRGIYEFDSSSSDLPRASLSRASSTSSRSSSQHSHHSSAHSQGSVHRGVITPADPATIAPTVKSCCASLATMNTSSTTSSSVPRRPSIPYSPPGAAIVHERTYPYDTTDISSARMF